MRNFSFALFIALSLTACSGCTTDGGEKVAPEVVASQTLSLAESTATAALVIATDLSRQDTISVDQLKQVIAANRIVDTAVRAGFAALNVHDVNSALAALQSPEVATALRTLQSLITSRRTP